MAVRCPKCGHLRRPDDSPPLSECPRCGVVYARFQAHREPPPGGEPAGGGISHPAGDSPGGGRPRRILLALAILVPVAVIALLFHQLPVTSDPAPFAVGGMTLDGHPYPVPLQAPVGRIVVMEAGIREFTEFGVIFPLAAPGGHLRPGIELVLPAGGISLGEAIAFAPGDGSGIRLSFAPPLSGTVGQGGSGAPIALEYRLAKGGGVVRIDRFEPQEGGMVAGEILQAELEGWRFNLSTGEEVPGGEARHLVLQGIPFTARFQVGP